MLNIKCHMSPEDCDNWQVTLRKLLDSVPPMDIVIVMLIYLLVSPTCFKIIW